MTPGEAERIAYVAHGACGQRRADGKTPYIRHPARVAELTKASSSSRSADLPATGAALDDRLVAAWLHDVVEDTKLRPKDLVHLGISHHQLDLVDRLTERADESPAEYFARIAASEDALVVKCADRCSNVEDALADLMLDEPRSPERWSRYLAKTNADMLPLYASLPRLSHELTTRLRRMQAALPAALEKRAASIERKTSGRGVRRST